MHVYLGELSIGDYLTGWLPYEGNEICIKVHFRCSLYKVLLRRCSPWVPRRRLTLVHESQHHLMCGLGY